MALRFEDKQAVVAEVAKVAAEAKSVVVAEYRGMTADEMTVLRKNAREEGVSLRVVKNSLAKRAVEGTEFACIQEVLAGPVMLGFSLHDPVSVAKVISKFAKGNSKLVVKAVSLNGKLLPASELETLAKMPSYEQAIAILMSVMNAPVTQLVRTLAEPHAKLVRTIAAIREQKEKAA